MTEQRQSRWEDLTFDKDGRLIDLNGPLEFKDYGPPPQITWTLVMDLPEVFGRRAATMNSKGPTYDLRIASEVFQDAGGWYVHLSGKTSGGTGSIHRTAGGRGDRLRRCAGRPVTSGSGRAEF
jgi:hypothetical protein